MVFFKERSYKKELLDEENIPFEHIRQNMQELDTINRFLGGHRITINGFKTLYNRNSNQQELQVVEIGCGGGDNLRAIAKWAKSKGIKTKLSGIDINPECIEFAQSRNKNHGINFICADYKDIIFEHKPGIVFSSLLCHHFSNENLVVMLRWMKEQSSVGFFINDLHRYPAAYYSIKTLTQLFSKSYLVKNDAPLSVLRGFKKVELEKLFSNAGITNYSIQWQWAFRWLAIYAHG